jgi:ATP-dependent protease HslVU (ClpYQ) peptidase subunit
MTTVAYRDGVLASDSRLTCNKDWIENDNSKKIYKLSDGSAVGVAGSAYQSETIIERLKAALKTKDKKLPKVSDLRKAEALLVCPDGDLWFHPQGGYSWQKMPDAPTALGSGWQWAMVAMDAGADARRAVELAIRRDVYSGGKIQTCKVF